jgi:hypothetical protein
MPSFLLARNKNTQFKYQDEANMTLVLPFEPMSKPYEIDDELAFARQRDV